MWGFSAPSISAGGHVVALPRVIARSKTAEELRKTASGAERC